MHILHSNATEALRSHHITEKENLRNELETAKAQDMEKLNKEWKIRLDLKQSEFHKLEKKWHEAEVWQMIKSLLTYFRAFAWKSSVREMSSKPPTNKRCATSS